MKPVISLETINETDIPELTRAMTKAFDDDAKTHLGIEKGGPEGYDNGDFFRKWLFTYDECKGYKIVVEGKIVGGLLVWINDEGDYVWGNVFVDPFWQNKGVCTQAWLAVESLHPEAKSWTLETPGYSKKNHRVYERLGFVKIKEVDTPDHPGKSFIFRKVMPS